MKISIGSEILEAQPSPSGMGQLSAAQTQINTGICQ